jgi:hypothetical protein
MLREDFGEYSLSRTEGFEWHSHFKAGRAAANGRKRCGSVALIFPLTETVTTVRVRELSDTTSVKCKAAHSRYPQGTLLLTTD